MTVTPLWADAANRTGSPASRPIASSGVRLGARRHPLLPQPPAGSLGRMPAFPYDACVLRSLSGICDGTLYYRAIRLPA
jgi:hypothetical protein